jgi:hypothetical protein
VLPRRPNFCDAKNASAASANGCKQLSGNASMALRGQMNMIWLNKPSPPRAARTNASAWTILIPHATPFGNCQGSICHGPESAIRIGQGDLLRAGGGTSGSWTDLPCLYS